MGLKKNPSIMLKKIFIKTFGCQMNEYDSNRIFDTVKKIGFEKTDKYEDANCYLLNTCHIRDKAKEKVYHEIGRVKKIFREKKKPIVIVAGCVAQAENQEMLKREPYIDIVVGPQAYHKLPELINNFNKDKNKNFNTDLDVAPFSLENYKNISSKVSSKPIQEGCDKFCKFCVVPYTRGPEFSRSPDQIYNEVLSLVERGTREITLLGQNVSGYQHENTNLSKLIDKVASINDLERIRFTTSHPNDFNKDLIDAFKFQKKLMIQFICQYKVDQIKF